MTPETDSHLLHQFTENQSNDAFEGLVARYVNLVYSVALRQSGNRHDAEEITQAVFVVLARKAGNLRHEQALSSWLFQATRLTAKNFLRGEMRRRQREQEAFMQSVVEQGNGVLMPSADAAWPQLAPVLDAAVESLGETDRRAIVLRFYEGRNLREVGLALGATEDAAKKRVARALEKIRRHFAKRGVVLATGAIGAIMTANAVKAAPADLGKTIAAAAIKGARAGVLPAALEKGVLKALLWKKYGAFITCGTTILITGAMVFIVAISTEPPVPPSIVVAVQTNKPAVIREPLVETMKFMLESPPGGLALQPDGKIIVGTTLFGRFVDETNGSMGFYTRGAFRLNPDGTLDRTFRCDVTPPGDAPQMAHVDILPDGRLFLSGLFGTVDGKPYPNYAVLFADGTPDESFRPWRGETNQPAPFFLPQIDSPHIWGLTGYQGGAVPAAWLPDNTVAVACKSIENTSYFPPLTAYRLDSSGTWIKPKTKLLAGTYSRPSGLIDTLTLSGFWARRAIDWTNLNAVAPRPPFRYGSDLLKLEDSPPVRDLAFESWTPAPTAGHAAILFKALFEEIPIELCRYASRTDVGGTILAIRVTPNNGLDVCGRLMRFDKDWLPDSGFTNQYECDLRSCLSIKQQNDGRLLVAGLIGKMNGENFSGLMRLLPDGQTDHSFHCDIINAMEGRVMDMVVQDDGRIVICGFFSRVNGVEVPHIARLNSDGSLDTSFQTAFLSQERFYDEFRKFRRVMVATLPKPASPGQTGAIAAKAPETILITLMKMEANGALIQFSGSANHQYVLQARDSLSGADWQTINTNQTTSDGTGLFRDADAGQHPMRFYRIASQ